MATSSRRRIHALDELRGLSILLMVFFHAFYLLGTEYHLPLFTKLYDFFLPAQPFFAAFFIFLCGVCCNFSHNNLKRGVLLLGAALLLSGVMWCAVRWRMIAPGNQIWFGILHLLAVCILLYVLFRPTLKFIPPWLGLLLCAVLFLLCYHVPPDMGGYFGIRGWYTVPTPAAAPDHPLLYVLGLCPISPCGDYFPLLPYAFCFFGGTFCGVWAVKGKFPKALYRSRFPFFSLIGKHTLWIYLLHQPVLFGIVELIDLIFR